MWLTTFPRTIGLTLGIVQTNIGLRSRYTPKQLDVSLYRQPAINDEKKYIPLCQSQFTKQHIIKGSILTKFLNCMFVIKISDISKCSQYKHHVSNSLFLWLEHWGKILSSDILHLWYWYIIKQNKFDRINMSNWFSVE